MSSGQHDDLDLGDGLRAELELAAARADALDHELREAVAVLADLVTCLSGFGDAVRSRDPIELGARWAFTARAHAAAVTYGRGLCERLGIDPDTCLPATRPEETP